MKLLQTTALLAFAGMALVGSTANAAPVTYNTGDLLLGFETTGNGSSNTVVVDIGNFQLYRDAAPGSSFTIDLGTTNLGGILDSTFGSGVNTWTTRDDVYWGVFGATRNTAISGPGADTTIVNGDNSSTFYASRPESPVGTQAAAWSLSNQSSQVTVAGHMLGVEGTFSLQSDTNGSNLAVIPTSTVNSYEDENNVQATPNVSFVNLSGGIQGNFGSGTAGTALDLFRVANQASGTRTGTYLGTFTINDSGVLNYTAAVPEPSSIALLSMGGMAAFLGRRRRSNA